MAEIDVHEVAIKLIGPISPVGETNTDAMRLENLRRLISLTDKLLIDIGTITSYENAHEHSKKLAGRTAKQFLSGIEVYGD